MSNSNSPTSMAAPAEAPAPAHHVSGIFHDLEALKIQQHEAGLAGSTEVLMRVPVRKPQRDEYFRVRPGDEFTTVLYEDRVARVNYFITPAMLPLLRAVSNVSVVTLVPFITRQKMLGIFPLKLATDAIGDNGWQTTAMAAAQLAKTKWVRMQADMALSGYRIFSAEGQLSEPEWPDTPFNELLDIAFKDYVIASEDHPVLNRIMGRI
jgi:hypothetical protein